MGCPVSVLEWKAIGRFEVCLATLDQARLRQFGLSPREWQTLTLIAAGNTSGEIAVALNVQRSTIETFKKRIYEKLEINTATEASSLAIAILSGVDIRHRLDRDSFE
ncbi:MAG: helix-turn-helix transcriptional regulator [Pseudomonadota bacterium]